MQACPRPPPGGPASQPRKSVSDGRVAEDRTGGRGSGDGPPSRGPQPGDGTSPRARLREKGGARSGAHPSRPTGPRSSGRGATTTSDEQAGPVCLVRRAHRNRVPCSSCEDAWPPDETRSEKAPTPGHSSRLTRRADAARAREFVPHASSACTPVRYSRMRSLARSDASFVSRQRDLRVCITEIVATSVAGPQHHRCGSHGGVLNAVRVLA